MKKAPAAFAQFRAKQVEERAEKDKAHQARQESLKRDEASMYKTIRTALAPYNNVELDGHQITLEKLPKDPCVFLNVDGKAYLVFRAKRESHTDCHCHYDEQCNCPSWTEIELDVHQVKHSTSYVWRLEILKDAAKLAEAIAAEMDVYERNRA
jgi:hypothetical protein